MKKSQLQDLIREAIDEVLNEDNSLEPLQNKANKEEREAALAQIALNQARLKKENNLDEMSRGPISYKLTDDYEDKIAELPYANSEKRMKWVNGIIDYVDEVGAANTTTIAQEKFGVPQPRIADYVRDMIRLGILEPEQEGVVPQFMRQTDDEDGDNDRDEPEYMDPEGGIAGDMSDEEVDAGFPNPRGSEEEPEAGEIETSRVSGASMSDDEFNAWMSYQELERRLANVKSNILKAKKSKPTPGDIRDNPSDEITNLRNLRKKLEDKMATIISQFPSVAKDYKAPEIDTPEEEPLDEWVKSRMQYYAGIKK